MSDVVLQTIGVLLAGLLAGEELIVRYGVHPALSGLEDRAHLQARIALVRRLRIVVPALMVPTVVVAAALIVLTDGDGALWRAVGAVFLVLFVLFSFLGTVPINIKVIDWDVDHPPSDWKVIVKRWERIDIFRSSAAIVAFVCFLVALAVQVP